VRRASQAAAAAALAAVVLGAGGSARADTQDKLALVGEGAQAFIDAATAQRQLDCPELNLGVAGFAGGRETDEQRVIRSLPDRGNGLHAGDPTDAPSSLPERVLFKTRTASFNRRYYVAARDGRLYFKSNVEQTGIDQPWRHLVVPKCFEGDVQQLSLDDDELIAVDSERRVYTMDGALADPLLFTWTSRWGAPFWQGNGWRLPDDVRIWAWSVLSIPEDGTYKDGGGNDHPVGEGKVSHIWQLRDGGRRLTFNDPWLPRDASYELCGPHRGRFRAVNLAVSGSTLFLVGRRGDLFTRLWDFDLGGFDPFFETYSYEDQRGKRDPAVQLPAPPWVRQPKVPGRITDRITIEKVGRGTVHRTLRVEGRDARGRTGYWEKDITAPVWHFVPTGLPLGGRPLTNPRRDTSRRALAPSEDRRYVRDGADWSATLENFNWACSPARLVVRPAGGPPLTLRLHALDSIRQQPRAVGLDDHPRHLTGVVEVPVALLSQPFVRDVLLGG